MLTLISHENRRALAALVFATAGLAIPAHASFISTVTASDPLAFWTLETVNGVSQVNGYTTTDNNGVTEASSGGSPSSQAALLDGVNDGTPQYISTSLSGGINGSGSIMAWVNLAALPNGGAPFYIAGESSVGNDFDFQFDSDNGLGFYTGGGEHTAYTFSNPADDLIGQWHMLLVTYTGGGSGSRDIYVDGVNVASFNGSVNSSPKTTQFNIGYSTVFPNRDFNGMISNVAVWDRVLTADEVAGIYGARNDVGPQTPEPGTFLLFGAGLLGAQRVRRRSQRV